MYRKVLTGFALIAAFTAPGVSLAGESLDSIRRQLALIVAIERENGYRYSSDWVHVDALRDDDDDDYSFTLQTGSRYKIVGVCDNDCSDMDMTLRDGNRNLISRDTSSDSLPIVEVNPRWTGKFHLNVKMYSCSVSPCAYAFAVLER